MDHERLGRGGLRAAVVAALPKVLVLAAVLLTVAALCPSALAWQPGEPFGFDFPRLGMWWPDAEEQELSAIARYDYVILGPWDDEGVASALRARNPDIVLLNATNACEIDFDPSPAAPSWATEELRRASPRWLLTQVGADLRADVNAAATTLPVSRVTASSGGRTYRLFVPGDFAVIGEELVLVREVDAAAKTLRVRRGVVWPAAAHAAGDRVAAAVSHWPQSLIFDQSTYCPTATVDASVGPETWVEYNARVSAALVADDVWDGLLIDRADGGESWLVGGSRARTIDPDRSGRVVDDEYAAFDAAWNAGLRRYEELVRAALPDKLVYVNWGHPNHDLLNGNNFEGFPDDHGSAYGRSWGATVFGSGGTGGYLDWLDRSLQPNLSTIETYEDDGSPDASEDGSYDNPASRPGFRPDYRKMRFGLTTALLGDGFFSYEINTNGHGSLGLLWFDEYVGGGRGRGYLGQPTGPPRRVAGQLTSPVLTAGGGFESAADVAGWDWWTAEEYAGTVERDTTTAAQGSSSLRIDVTRAGGQAWRAAVSRGGVALVKGRDYTLSFWAKADRPRDVSLWAQQRAAPWKEWLDLGAVRLTTAWTRYVVSARARGADERATLHVGVGQETGTVWLDDVRLQRGSRDVWRRDYDRGTAIVNATSGARVVPLDGVWHKLRGRQVPAVNDGAYVTQVRLPARDGVILVRATEQEASAARVLAAATGGWRRCAREAARARAWYAARARRASGSARVRLTRAAAAWARARAAAAAERARLSAARAQLDIGRTLEAAAQAAAAEAKTAAALATVRAAHASGRAAPSAPRARRHAAAAARRTASAAAALAALR